MMERVGKMLSRALHPAWLTGPIFDKELRVASRRRRQYVLRFLYILVLALFAGVVWVSRAQYQGNVAFVQSRMAQAGKETISTIVLFQFFALQVLAVVLLSGAISDEIYHRTLGTLMTTPITSVQIVLGKLLSRLLQLILLLAISLPMLAITRVLGGVPWGYLWESLCITLTAAIFAGSVSLLFSIKNHYAYGVIVRTLFVLACVYLFLPVLGGVLGLYLTGFGLSSSRLVQSLSPAALVVFSLNPAVAMETVTQRMLSSGAGPAFPVPLHCGVMLGLSALVLARAVIVVRRVALRQAVGQLGSEGQKVRSTEGERTLRSSSVLTFSPSSPKPAVRRVVGPPVVWKELRAPFIQGLGPRNSYIGLSMAVVALGLTYLAAHHARCLDAEFTHVSYVLLFVFLGGLIDVIFSATRITAEKESQSWLLLLTTPLSDRDILLGKAFSALRRCLPVWGLLAGHLVLFTLAGYIHPVASLHLLVIVAGLTCFLTGAGLYFSARFARTTSAVVATFALAVGLWVVGPTLAGLLGVMGGKNDWLAAYTWTHPAVQTGIVVGGAAGPQNAHAPWRSLDYRPLAVSRSNQGPLHVGAMTYILLYVATAYILAGLLFFWRAECCLRRRVFG